MAFCMLSLISAIIIIVLGAVLFIGAISTGEAEFVAIGMSLLIAGLLALWPVLIMRNTLRRLDALESENERLNSLLSHPGMMPNAAIVVQNTTAYSRDADENETVRMPRKKQIAQPVEEYEE